MDLFDTRKLVLLWVFLVTGCAGPVLLPPLSHSSLPPDMELSQKTCVLMSAEEVFDDPRLRSLAQNAVRGEIEKIIAVVKSGVDPNQRGLHGCTVLFWAFQNELSFQALLELNADPNLIFDDGGSVIHWATRINKPVFLELLLQHGGDPNLQGWALQQTPLFIAAVSNQKEKLKLLMDRGANLDVRDLLGRTAAMAAAAAGQFEIVLILLEAGAAHDVVDFRGRNLADIVRYYYRRDQTFGAGDASREKVLAWLAKNGE